VASQFYLHSGKQRKVVMVGNDSPIAFGKKIRWWKRKCETMCCVATASSYVDKVRGEVLSHVHAVAVKHHSGMFN
jgi:hypothetical protein